MKRIGTGFSDKRRDGIKEWAETNIYIHLFILFCFQIKLTILTCPQVAIPICAGHVCLWSHQSCLWSRQSFCSSVNVICFNTQFLIGLKVCSIFAHLNNATNNLNNFDVHHACTQLHTWHKIDWKCIAGVFSSCTLSTALYFKECNYLSSVPSVVGYSKVAQSRLKISRVALLLAGSSTPSSLF